MIIAHTRKDLNMQLLKVLLGQDGLFKDNAVVGLSGLRKNKEYVKISIPESYKKTFVPNLEQNYILL